MFPVKQNVYADENGNLTYGRQKGRKLILVAGAVVSDKQAAALGLPELDKAASIAAVEEARKLNDPLAVLESAPANEGSATGEEQASSEDFALNAEPEAAAEPKAVADVSLQKTDESPAQTEQVVAEQTPTAIKEQQEPEPRKRR